MNRCRHEIIGDLLQQLTVRQLTITQLCQAGNIPVDRGKPILLRLMNLGMLVQTWNDRERVYELTDRGYEWLGLYGMLRKILP